MPLIDMKELETPAAELVVAELGAVRWELRDTPELNIQMRDYDVIFAAALRAARGHDRRGSQRRNDNGA